MTVISDPIINFKSTLELTTNAYKSDYSGHTNDDNEKYPSKTSENNNYNRSKVLHIVWQTLYEKYESFCKQTKLLKNLVNRESNKPLAKKFRHSLRFNKSAKKKGYTYFLSDEDQRYSFLFMI